MILSGGADGLIAVSSPTTGITIRVISDHQGAPINCIDVTLLQVRVCLHYLGLFYLLLLEASLSSRRENYNCDTRA